MIKLYKGIILIVSPIIFTVVPTFSQTPNEITILNSKYIYTQSGTPITISVICIDGYKYAYEKTSYNNNISTNLIQMYQEVQGVTMPIKCNPTEQDRARSVP
jgi:hypothetical protein